MELKIDFYANRRKPIGQDCPFLQPPEIFLSWPAVSLQQAKALHRTDFLTENDLEASCNGLKNVSTLNGHFLLFYYFFLKYNVYEK